MKKEKLNVWLFIGVITIFVFIGLIYSLGSLYDWLYESEEGWYIEETEKVYCTTEYKTSEYEVISLEFVVGNTELAYFDDEANSNLYATYTANEHIINKRIIVN